MLFLLSCSSGYSSEKPDPIKCKFSGNLSEFILKVSDVVGANIMFSGTDQKIILSVSTQSKTEFFDSFLELLKLCNYKVQRNSNTFVIANGTAKNQKDKGSKAEKVIK